MNEIIGLAAEKLTGWDFLIAGLIVLFTEYVIKNVFKDGDKFKFIWKLAPVAIGAVIYVILAFIQKGVWYTSLAHGLLVGLTSMGSYDIILKTIKEAGVKSIQDANEALKKAIEGDKK